MWCINHIYNMHTDTITLQQTTCTCSTNTLLSSSEIQKSHLVKCWFSCSDSRCFVCSASIQKSQFFSPGLSSRNLWNMPIPDFEQSIMTLSSSSSSRSTTMPLRGRALGDRWTALKANTPLLRSLRPDIADLFLLSLWLLSVVSNSDIIDERTLWR